MKKEKQDKGLCRLELSPGSGEKCRPWECKGCGWNASVDFRRKETIRKKGLEKRPDGLRRLILRREEDGPKPLCGGDE